MPAVPEQHRHETRARRQLQAAAPSPDRQPAVPAIDPIDRRVASRLAARRRALGLDAQLLDVILGLRDGTIERLESGHSRIAPSHLCQLAQIFDVTVDWFFSESIDPPPVPLVDVRAGAEENAEARRFLSLYTRLDNPDVRAHVRDMVKAIADSGLWPHRAPPAPPAGGAPPGTAGTVPAAGARRRSA